MRRVLDCMIDQGVDGICILANYSEQFLLTDEERNVLQDLSLRHVAGRVPVIVTCSHFQHAHRCGSRTAGGRGRRRHAHADAALSWRAAEGRRGRHAAAFRAGRRGGAHPHHDPGCALERRDPQRAVPGQARARGAAGELLQDRGAGHGRQAARPDCGGRRRHRRPVRRRGEHHADGRSRRRRHRHDAERSHAGPDQADPRPSRRRPAQGGRRPLSPACCRSSTTRTGSAACAPPRR